MTAPASPVWVALDTPDVETATALAQRLRGTVGGLKLGLEYFSANGPAGVRALSPFGLPIFLDVKLHDIPNTVAGALRALSSLEPAIVSVHAAGGRAMMEAARAACGRATRLIAVSMLTSLDEADLRATGVASGPEAHVRRLALLARESGLDGAVCSPAEVAALRADWPEALLVTPGIRPPGSGAEDQKRMATPGAALAAGADILVVGRPITAARDPLAAAEAILAGLKAPADVPR